ncbi:hypothetical protein [Brachyspira pulli]|uniref:hypothetical protein n=2 Tax=Brachyspira pulli TaxID=310721 RepID=UPI003005BB47
MKLANSTTPGSATDGTFIDKDNRNDIPGTRIEANIFNQLIFEFDKLIKEGGLIPSDKDLTQVYTAIRNLYTNADNDLKNYLENKVSIESSKIFEEIKNIKEVDEYLENQITEEKNKINKEITDRKNADISLHNEINTASQKINQEIIYRENEISRLEDRINSMKKSYCFIIKETVTKTGTGTQQWNLTWRNDVEYIMMRGSVSCNHTNFGWSADYGFFQDFNKDEAAFIGMKAYYAERYYFGNTAVQTVNVNGAAAFEAGLSHEKWFPLNSIKPVLGIKNMNQTTTITASLEFLVRYK